LSAVSNRTSVVEFSPGGQEKKKQGRAGEEKLEHFQMIFSGTLIQDLIATVERAERLREVSSRSGAIAMTMTVTTTSGECPLEDSLPGVESSPIELWLTSVEQNTNYDPKLLGVA
jgi:hypothetical protein